MSPPIPGQAASIFSSSSRREKAADASSMRGENSQDAGLSGILSRAMRTISSPLEQGEMRTLEPSMFPVPLFSMSVPAHTSLFKALWAASSRASPRLAGAISSRRNSSPPRAAPPNSSLAASLQVTISRWPRLSTSTGYCARPSASWHVPAAPLATKVAGSMASVSRPKYSSGSQGSGQP